MRRGIRFGEEKTVQFLAQALGNGVSVLVPKSFQHQPIDMHYDTLHTHPRVSTSVRGRSRLAASS